MSKTLHFYTLPGFWEISADLPYPFVYTEFINADIFRLFSRTLNSKSFCKIRVYSLLSNSYKASNTALDHISIYFKYSLKHLDKTFPPHLFSQAFWAMAGLNSCSRSPHIDEEQLPVVQRDILSHSSHAWHMHQYSPNWCDRLLLAELWQTEWWRAANEMEGKMHLPSHSIPSTGELQA